MKIETAFNVGDEVCFMKMNLPREGLVVGINLKSEAADKSNPDFARTSVRTKISYKILPYDYEAAEKDGCVYMPEDGVFASRESLAEYLFG